MNETPQETCSHCGANMVTKKVTVLRKKKGKIYSFTDTPAQVCLECGEKWYASETLKMLDEMMKGTVDFPHQSIEAIEFNLSSETTTV